MFFMLSYCLFIIIIIIFFEGGGGRSLIPADAGPQIRGVSGGDMGSHSSHWVSKRQPPSDLQHGEDWLGSQLAFQNYWVCIPWRTYPNKFGYAAEGRA